MATFSKRHYEAIAAVLAERRAEIEALESAAPLDDTVAAVAARRDITLAIIEVSTITVRLARMFKADNPAFLAKRFGAAAGMMHGLAPFVSDEVATWPAEPLSELDAWRAKHIGATSNVVQSNSRKAERQS